MPFCSALPTFPNSRDLAVNRFLALERRLIKQPKLYAQYKNFMQEYLSLGYMEQVIKLDGAVNTYYIPHHCVLKPTSTTTKLRVVFNGSERCFIKLLLMITSWLDQNYKRI